MLQGVIIEIKDLDTVYRIMEMVGYGVVVIEDDKLILFNNYIVTKCENGSWCTNTKINNVNRYFANLYLAVESVMINKYMSELAVAIEAIKEYDENLVNLED